MTDTPHTHRILVIDDDPAMRRLLQLALEKAGYDAREAPEGATGLRIARNEPCSLAVVDLLMPGKDGLETMPALRRTHPSLAMIAISGGSGPLDLPYAADSFSAMKIFTKPFPIDDLIAANDEKLAQPR